MTSILKPSLHNFAFVALAMTLFVSGTRAEALKIVGFGDSLMAGYQLPSADAFPTRLQTELTADGVEVEIANAGVSGDTSTSGLSRLNWSVPDGTHGVILELGANDALRGISPTATRENMEAMISSLLEREISVLLVGMLAPPNMGEDYGQAFNSIYPDLAKKYDIPLYPFFLDGVAADPKLNLSDGIHPNPDGITIMVEKMKPIVVDWLAGLSTAN